MLLTAIRGALMGAGAAAIIMIVAHALGWGWPDTAAFCR